jgi:hypothetical protein
VRLVTAGGEEQGGSWHEHGAQTAESGPLLESLAVITEALHPALDMRWVNESGHSGLLVAVMGSMIEQDKPALTRMKHSAATAMAVVLDVDAWVAPKGPDTATMTAWMASHGWRVVTAGPRDPIPAMWHELGMLASARRSSSYASSGQAGEAVP